MITQSLCKRWNDFIWTWRKVEKEREVVRWSDLCRFGYVWYWVPGIFDRNTLSRSSSRKLQSFSFCRRSFLFLIFPDIFWVSTGKSFDLSFEWREWDIFSVVLWDSIESIWSIPLGQSKTERACSWWVWFVNLVRVSGSCTCIWRGLAPPYYENKVNTQ